MLNFLKWAAIIVTILVDILFFIIFFLETFHVNTP